MNRKSIAMMLTGIILVSLNMFVLTGVVASQVQAGVGELIVADRDGVIEEGQEEPDKWERDDWLVQTLDLIHIGRGRRRE